MTDDQVHTIQQAMVERGLVTQVEAMIEVRRRDALAALDSRSLSSAGLDGLAYVTELLTRRDR